MSKRRTWILEAAVRVIARDGVRGLRVEELAAAAEVSTALIYYHFRDRAGLLRAALDHVNQRAVSYTDAELGDGDPRSRVRAMVLAELHAGDDVHDNSVAWGELRASAVFHEDLREPLRTTTEAWIADLAVLIGCATGTSTGSGIDAAERLTALVEGLSQRWHSGTVTLERARELLDAAVGLELGERD
ncbi:MAG: TetR/AcrR family transcriptional regulator [Mycobacteriaceae bacterium]|nr:TetR/AcrR family transcriptional regulator [Mycobacteriaceae bacterium]